MTELWSPYAWAILFVGMTGALSLVQLLLFDLVAIKTKHTPGFPIENNHNNLLFRLSRAHANINETLGAMLALVLFAMFSAADPFWVNACMAIYWLMRVAHMVCYYAAWSLLRGWAFGFSLLALLGLLVAGLMAWW